MARRKQTKNKSTFVLIVLIILFVGMVGGGIYVKNSPNFETEPPKITKPKNLIWNKKMPLEVEISDNKGLKYYKVTISDGNKTVNIVEGQVEEPELKKKMLQIAYPENEGLKKSAKTLFVKVHVRDNSQSNYLEGNVFEDAIILEIDNKRPNVNVVSNSYMITQGGSALVVFQAGDKNIEEIYIEDGDNRFKAQPYKREGYYVSLIAWPFNVDTFNPKIVVTDKAGNERTVQITFFTKNHTYKTSHIRASDRFINGKITTLAEDDPDYMDVEGKVEKFKSVNESMRLKNEALIHKMTKFVSDEPLQEWKINKFYPLKNGQKVASYGDERHYYYNDKSNIISHSYHVGYDLASTKMADIKTSNAGKVVFAQENGIYGNLPIIDHGLGLYSLYGHCSTVNVKEGDVVKSGDVIGKTGVSGLALGDHLHFGLLIQGVEVRPVEWFDQDWIRKSIDNVFKEADTIIEGKKSL